MFWKTKKLQEMTTPEWESLCDGCALCCCIRLEDEDTHEMVLTNVSCSYLDHESCGCGDYKNRQTNVPDCVKLTPENLEQVYWMPETCAYRLLYTGSDLPDWHPLLTGDKDSVHKAGISLKGQMISENEVDDLESYVLGSC
jgi:uncharacterized cysteine cluster protein YcgN (CxxCxxCC family)